MRLHLNTANVLREFSHISAVVIYPGAGPEVMCDVIHETVARLQTQHPDALQQ